jgi:RND family efflux transporter MFP subunit
VESSTTSRVASEVAGAVKDLVAREGTRVEKGQPVVKLRTETLELQLAAAQGALKEAEARLDRAERALGRAKDLLAKELISAGDFDDAQSEFKAWEGKVAQLSAEVGQTQLDLDRSTIRAPFTGTVVAEHVDLGEWVGVGDPVVDMVSTDRMDVRVDVPGRYFGLVALGAEAAVTFESTSPTEIGGKITAIVPRADATSRTFPVKVSIPNREGRVAVGMLAQASIPVGDPKPSIIVPKDAVVSQGSSRFIYVVAPDSTASMTPVATGTGTGSWIAVTGNVKAGQAVVTRGNERLRPGQKVLAQPEEYPLP